MTVTFDGEPRLGANRFPWSDDVDAILLDRRLTGLTISLTVSDITDALQAYEDYKRLRERARAVSSNEAPDEDEPMAEFVVDRLVAKALNKPLNRSLEMPTDQANVRFIQALPTEDKQRLAMGTAATINQVLARAFLRLGPPPEGATGDNTRVPTGGGGAEQ
ncbi:hypothetical protein [Streptomyces sp. NPDC001068]|uniref:hypothetical protein n=1 Tax=Streptomyces sp. NPDC001068 TaxID=3364544 RepID=UPI003693AF91